MTITKTIPPEISLLLALALAVAVPGCEDPPQQPPPESETPPVAELEPEVVSTTGRVERQGADAQWVPVAAGDRLAKDAAIRTGPDGTADLSLSKDATVTIQPESQVGVVEITEAAGRLKLRRGRLSVTQEQAGERVLRIEGEDGQVVEARGAKFTVRKSDTSFAVATETGSVDLESAGATVAVAAGKQAVALAGAIPSAAAPIPTELLLRVARAANRDKSLCAIVEGKANPGAEVLVAGSPATLDGDGSFRVEVPRRPETDAVEVVTTDADGRTRTEKLPCQVLPAPSRPKPEQGSKIEDLSIQWGGGGEDSSDP